MPISPDIRRAIEIVDQRIQSLQKIKEMLLKEFGGEETSSEGQQILWPSPSVSMVAKKTRKEALINFLKTSGPSSRQEIETKTGMPKGTVAFLLNDKETFQRLQDGKWTVR